MIEFGQNTKIKKCVEWDKMQKETDFSISFTFHKNVIFFNMIFNQQANKIKKKDTKL